MDADPYGAMLDAYNTGGSAPPALPPSGTPSAADLQARASQFPDMPQPNDTDAAQMANDLRDIAARKATKQSNPADPYADMLNAYNNPGEGNLSVGSGVRNFGAGANEALAGVAGVPVDAAASLMSIPSPSVAPDVKAAWAARHPTAAAVTNAFDAWNSGLENPAGGSEWIKRNIFGLIGANPEAITPQTGFDQAMRSAGSGAVAMASPALAGRALLGSGVANAGPLMNTITNGTMLGNAAVGAGAGAGGQVLGSQVPTQYQPLGQLAGNILGGGLVAAPGAALRYATSGVGDLLGRLFAPFTETGREGIAARTLQNAATDPRAAAYAAGNAPAFVPGSQPTLAQASADPGLLILEAKQAANAPEGFAARQAAQQSARTSALNNVQSAGNPEAVGDFVRAQLANAHDAADQALQRVGGTMQPQEAGQAMRAGLQEQKNASKGQEAALWRAIDPEKQLAIDVTPTRLAADNIANRVGQYARAPEGEEGAILGNAQMLPSVMKFSDFTDLRGRLLSAIRQERSTNGVTPALARMQQLRQAMDETIATGAQRQAEQEAETAARDGMASEDTMMSRMQSYLEAEREGYYAKSDVASLTNTGTDGRGGTPGARADARITSTALLGPGRAEMPTRGQSGNASGDQSLSRTQQRLTPNFDAAAAQRYRAAADATRIGKETFGQGSVGKALKSGETAGTYRLTDSQVGPNFLKNRESVQQFVKAAGGNQQAMNALEDYAASQILKSTRRADGTFDPTKVNRWLETHEHWFEPFPELADKFRDVASTQQAVDDIMGRRVASANSEHYVAASRFLQNDPSIAFETALRAKNAPAEMANLVRTVSQDQTGEALDGLRRTAVESMTRRLMTGRASDFIDFVQKNRAALGYVLPGDRMQTIDNIASDLQRSNLGAGQSAKATTSGGHTDNLFLYFLSELLGHASGHVLAGPAGAVALKVGSLFRSAGLRKADDILTEAMLNPELGRTLLMKFDKANTPAVMARLAAQLKTLTTVSGAQEAQQEPNGK